MADSKPGNGKSDPFGNGAGATGGGEASGARDFVKNPKGQTGGDGQGHDFLTDPKSHSPATGGHDFTDVTRPQQMGSDPTCNPQEIPAGGKQLLADPPPQRSAQIGTTAGTAQRKPFRVGQ